MVLRQQISYANHFAQHQLGFQWLEWISEKSTNSDAYEENHRVQQQLIIQSNAGE
jgi:hypothetical protein